MGISLGSSSKKPYVGSKEVKEAYVGSQKVYSAAPPIYYGFLGAENDYVIEDWCNLTRGASIKKYSNIYRIAVNGSGGSTTNKITLTEIKGNVLKFLHYCNGTTSENNWPKIQWQNESGGIIRTDRFNGRGGADFTLKNYTVPTGATKCTIDGYNNSGSATLYLDAIRFETE